MFPTEDPLFSDEIVLTQSSVVPTDARLFTIDQANKALALIRVITRDIVFRAKSMTERRKRLELLQEPESHASSNLYSEELKDIEKCLISDALRLRELVGEISQVGVLIQSIPAGRVLFLTHREGRPVYLTWGFGEDQVDRWIEIGEDFEMRRPWSNPDPELSPERRQIPEQASLTLRD